MIFRTIVTLVAVFVAIARGPVALAGEPKETARCANPATDTDVWMVRSGGLWKEGATYGNFRVLLVRQGVEHAIDHVEVQVTTAKDSARAIRSCVVVHSPGLKGYVTDIRIHSVDTKSAAIELDVEMKAMNGVILKEVFVAFADGRVTLVSEAKYVDLMGLGGK